MTTAAVWGASGFIGHAVASAALDAGWRVRRLQRHGEGDIVRLAQEDDEARMRPAVAGCDIAYHCAGKALEGDPAGYADAAGRFARACADVQVSRLVYVGTVAVYGSRAEGDVRVGDPLSGTGPYAQSRIAAERAMAEALRGTPTRLVVVRVPAVVGKGMPGTVIARFVRALRWGVFPHPGPRHATFPCIGVRRLARILVLLREARTDRDTLQFADHPCWTEIAGRIGARTGRRIRRLPLPALGGKFSALSSTARYADDVERVLVGTELPDTNDDLDAAIAAALRP